MKTNFKNLTLLSFLICSFLVSQPIAALNASKSPRLPSLPPVPDFSNQPKGFPEKPSLTPKIDNDIPLQSNQGLIEGKVINADTKEPISNARIVIPQLNGAAKADDKGNFKFEPLEIKGEIEPGTPGQFVNLKVIAPGFGEHTMVDVGVFPGITATVTLELKKGNKPTKWFGLLRPEEREQKKIPDLEASSLTVGITGYSSQTVPPPYIRVAIRETNPATGKPNATGTVIRTDIVDFDFYVKHVLPQEWGPSWHSESLKAGAMAVKEYGWYWVNQGGKYPQYNADVDNSVNSQIYNPNISYSSTDNAVNNTSANGWYQNGKIFQSQYCAGSYDSTYSCGSNKMSQYGSKYWADQGKTYQWILNYYYSPTPTYFTIKPRSPKLYASTVSSNSVTLNFSSPGATWYQVNKWANGTWNNVVYFGPNKSFTDTGLTSNKTYYYIAVAWNSAGWGPWSFNNGHMATVAKSPSNPPAPITDSFYITKSEIGLKVQSSVQSLNPNVTWYQLIKWNGSSWQTIYFGSPQVLNPACMKVINGICWPLNPDQQLPNPYVDKRDKSFYYFDKNLTASTGYYYSIAVYDPTLGWSNWLNYNGYVYAVTQPTY